MKTEIRTLTGLRGIAATWVALYHIHWKVVASGSVSPVLRHGYIAVDIFFVLSGYVMMMTYNRNANVSWSVARYLDFIIRRIGRIWPAYALVTICLSGLMVAGILRDRGLDVRTFLINITLTESWWRVSPIDQPAWSVSAELAAYFVFPLLALIVVHAHKQMLSVYIIAIFAAIWYLPALQVLFAGHLIIGNGPFDISSGATIAPMVRCFTEFFLGMLLFKLATPKILSLAQSSWVSGAVLITFGVLTAIPSSDFYLITTIPALVLVVSASGPLCRAVFDNIPVYTIGCWSYSLYLIHFHTNAIQIAAAKLLGGILPFNVPASYAVQYATLIISSGLIYRFIERPGLVFCRDLGKRLERHFGSEPLQPEPTKGAV